MTGAASTFKETKHQQSARCASGFSRGALSNGEDAELVVYLRFTNGTNETKGSSWEGQVRGRQGQRGVCRRKARCDNI